MLSTREISLSDHVKRRRSTPAVATAGRNGQRGRSPSSSSSSSSRGGGIVIPPPSRSRPRHDDDCDFEGGFDPHAASYGNCDAPSARCRGGHRQEPDHGCYAAESSIVAPSSYSPRIRPGRSSSSTSSPSGGDVMDPRRRRVEGHPQYEYGCSSPPPYYGYPAAREDDGSTTAYPRLVHASSSHSCCPSTATASTASGSSSGSSSRSDGGFASIARSVGVGVGVGAASSTIMEEEDIRRGITDISSLVATYLAGILALIVGVFLTLLSPFVRAVRLIVGDVRGLLGDLGIPHELGGVLWSFVRNLRRRSMAGRHRRRRGEGDRGGDDDDDDGQHRRRRHPRDVVGYHDDESADTDNSTVRTEYSPQFVGGWRPRVCPSVGSCGASADASSFRGGEGESSSTSYFSLPLILEDPYQGPHQDRRTMRTMEVSSCPPVVQKIPRQGRSSSFYAGGACGGGGGSGMHARRSSSDIPPKTTLECPQYYDDEPPYSRAPSRSPMKPSRPTVSGGNGMYLRSRSNVV